MEKCNVNLTVLAPGADESALSVLTENLANDLRSRQFETIRKTERRPDAKTGEVIIIGQLVTSFLLPLAVSVLADVIKEWLRRHRRHGASIELSPPGRPDIKVRITGDSLSPEEVEAMLRPLEQALRETP